MVNAETVANKRKSLITKGKGFKGAKNIAGDIEVKHYDKFAFARS